MKNIFGHVRWILGYDGVPLMARPTFRYDLLSSLFAAVGIGAIFPQLTAQFARRGLQASTWLIALLYVLMPLGNLLNTFFAQYLARSRRIPLVVAARIGMGVFLAAIAALPPDRAAAWPFAALLLIPSVLVAIVLNVQNSVRHSNYPTEIRGQVFGRLTIVRMGSMALSAMLAGYALDRLEWGHRLVYALAGCAMIVGAWFYSKMRVRRERAMLQGNLTRRRGILSGFRLLIEDRAYGRFMMWQMIFGFANIMTRPVLALVMTDYLDVSYRKGIGALVVTPFAVAVFTAGLAGKLFDHLRITHFRGISSALWAASRIIVFLGVLIGSWPLVMIGCVLQGLGQAMGSIAFNIGHTHFTSVDRSQEYMGIHLTLQGIRGLLGPMLTGALLTLPDAGLYILPVAGCVMFAAAIGFIRMHPPDIICAPSPAEEAFRQERETL